MIFEDLKVIFVRSSYSSSKNLRNFIQSQSDLVNPKTLHKKVAPSILLEAFFVKGNKKYIASTIVNKLFTFHKDLTLYYSVSAFRVLQQQSSELIWVSVKKKRK